MAATVRGAVRELLEQMMVTIDTLLATSDDELTMPSSHACAQGKDLWTLITNDIDHEKIHIGQVLEGRYESRITQSPRQRLIAEWLAERARLIGSNDTFAGAANTLLALIAGPIMGWVGVEAIMVVGAALMVPPFLMLLRLDLKASPLPTVIPRS